MMTEAQPRGREFRRLPEDDNRTGRSEPLPAEMEQRVRRLSAGQLDCLLLVDQHLSSKEIAGELGISSHTVDQRMRQALHILGVERRAQAARIVARHRGPYQRLIHQSPHIAATPSHAHPDPAIGIQIRHADRAGRALDGGFITEQRPAPGPFLQLPFATRNHPRNEMSVGQRLFWIAAIAIGSGVLGGHVSRRARKPLAADQQLGRHKSTMAGQQLRQRMPGREQSCANK